MQVITWQGGRWRAEQWPDGWRLCEHGGLVLQRANLDRVVTHLLDAGVDPERDMDQAERPDS